MSEATLRFNHDRFLQEVIGDAVLVIDIAGELCFGLDGAAVELWPALLSGTTRELLLREAVARYDAPAEEIREAVDSFLTELLEEALVVPVPLAPIPSTVTSPAPSGKRPFTPPRLARHEGSLEELVSEPD